MNLDIAIAGEIATAVAAIAAVAGLVVKWITSGVARNIKDVADDVETVAHTLKDQVEGVSHDLKNQTARVNALEHVRVTDTERIVKLETSVQSFDKAVGRVERGQDTLTDLINERFDTLAEVIRVMAVKAPRS